MADLEYQKVTHCIFDMDGLLLDTEKLYTLATQSILDLYGHTYTWEVKMSIMGLPTRPVAENIVKAYNLPMTWQQYADLQRENTEKLMVDAELMIDTECIYENITRQIARAYDKTYPLEVRLRLLGTTEKRSAEIAIEGCKLPITLDGYMTEYHKMGRELLGEAQLMPGAKRLLLHLHNNKIPFALATSSGKEMVDIKTTHHRELFSLFKHWVCGSTDPDVKEGKPNPDIFLVAAARFDDKPEPAKCLVFEDAPNGVLAGSRAGMQVVMVPDERVPAEMCSKATLVLKSLLDFKPEQFGLPPFSD